jgi:hypothetical protein
VHHRTSALPVFSYSRFAIIHALRHIVDAGGGPLLKIGDSLSLIFTQVQGEGTMHLSDVGLWMGLQVM